MTVTGEDRGRAADLLARLVHLSGLTPGALAARAGVSRALMGDYLRSAKQPSYAHRWVLLQELLLGYAEALAPQRPA